MIKYKRTYCEYFGYGVDDFIPCEMPDCEIRSGPPHHIVYKSRGGKDNIENLMGLCNYHHVKAHDEKLKPIELLDIHLKFMKSNKI